MASSITAGPLLSLAVTVTSEQHVEPVLRKTVEGLAEQPGVALVRIWLLPSAYIPNGWREVSQSHDGAEYLRLVASAGNPIDSPGEDWSFLQGRFSRFPLNAGKVGQVAADRRPILIKDLALQHNWVVRPEWAEREQIRSFAGHPLIFHGHLLGVIGLFSRSQLDEQEFAWLGLFANHAAVAIANARAFEEVAERQRAEAEARELASGLEAKVRQLVEANIVGIVMFTLDGVITEANDAFLHMLRYDRDDLTSGRIRWPDLTPPEWRSLDESAVADLKTSGIFQPFEKEYFRKDGARVPVLLGGTLVEGNRGEGVAFILDLTKPKQVEKALREKEESFRLIVDGIAGLVAIMTPSGEVQAANRQVLDYFGLPLERLKHWATCDVVHPADLAGVTSAWTRAIETGSPYDVDHRLRRADGIYRWFHARGLPLLDGDGSVIRWYVLLTDIDDRRRAEEALRRSEGFLAEGQHLSRTGSFSWRVATNEITWSEQLYRIYEFEVGVTVTRELIRTRVHPDDLTLFEKMVEQAPNAGNNLEWHYRLLMPDRSIKYLHAIAHSTRNQDGQLEYIAAVQDVTAQRRAELARDKARSELAQAARMLTIGTMAASIAHEINQPLSGIVTNAGTCQRMLSATPPNIDGAFETARRTIRDANRASDVITRLRALFNREETASELMDLNEATLEVIGLSLSGLQRNEVVVWAELADDLPPVTGDRIQLQQVILNLLRNAAEAMSTIEDRPRNLLVRTERHEADQVQLSVKDSGIGFAPHAADKMFEAFYTTKTDGMGIGLSISRSIIEAHRGRLWATPNDGPGSTFWFAIPYALDRLAAAQSAANPG